MPKFAALATCLENGLAINLRKSPRLAKNVTAKHAAATKAAKTATIKRLKINATRKIPKAMPRKIKLTLRFATLNKTKNNPPKIARINTKETIKYTNPLSQAKVISLFLSNNAAF